MEREVMQPGPKRRPKLQPARVVLTCELIRALDAEAARMDCSRSRLIRLAVQEWLDRRNGVPA
jgi:metal-responsive CopG/Arc/MetJ family transcriptional regulator